MRVTVFVLLALGSLSTILAVITNLDAKRIAQLHPPTGRFIEVEGGGQLHLVELGQEHGQAVVLLHGASANLGDMTLALGDRLSNSYRVTAIDRPGHGWSNRPGGVADAAPVVQARLIRQALFSSE